MSTPIVNVNVYEHNGVKITADKSAHTPKGDRTMSVLQALKTVLDCVDYTRPNCKPNELVGAVLPKEVIELARAAIAHAEGK